MEQQGIKESTYGDTSRYGETFRTWMAHDLMAAKPKVTMADMKNFNYSLAHGFGALIYLPRRRNSSSPI